MKKTKKVVMPLKDAIKTAVNTDDRYLDFNNDFKRVTVYGISTDNWPAGKEVIDGMCEGYHINDIFTIECEVENEKAMCPKFIRDLHTALNADCCDLYCHDCPLKINGFCVVPDINNKILRVWGDINAASEI